MPSAHLQSRTLHEPAVPQAVWNHDGPTAQRKCDGQPKDARTDGRAEDPWCELICSLVEVFREDERLVDERDAETKHKATYER